MGYFDFNIKNVDPGVSVLQGKSECRQERITQRQPTTGANKMC